MLTLIFNLVSIAAIAYIFTGLTAHLVYRFHNPIQIAAPQRGWTEADLEPDYTNSSLEADDFELPATNVADFNSRFGVPA